MWKGWARARGIVLVWRVSARVWGWCLGGWDCRGCGCGGGRRKDVGTPYANMDFGFGCFGGRGVGSGRSLDDAGGAAAAAASRYACRVAGSTGQAESEEEEEEGGGLEDGGEVARVDVDVPISEILRSTNK